MEKEDIRRLVRTAVEEMLDELEANNRRINDEDTLQDQILFDSLDEVDLTLRIEKAMDIRIDNGLERNLGEEYSIDDITDYIYNNFDKFEKL